MENGKPSAIAIVGVGAILPDAPNVAVFWENVKSGRYSIRDVTPDRWDPALYYDPDPSAPDKAYSKIGGWIREFEWEPMKWHLPIPPRVAASMDDAQKWAIACTHQALEDYGYPKRPLDLERTAVILGNAMAGEHHYLTALRLYFPEYARELGASESFAALPKEVRQAIESELHQRVNRILPEVTEDTMPGELSNCIAGRIANLFNTRGPNFVVDAACASAMAAFTAAAEGLTEKQFDVAITGGVDRNMGASTFIKFCKIGALSATGSRPYAEGADGFVMGEGAALFVMKRLADAERDGDKIYAVLRGIAGSSDGKGKGITAPNPIGQKLCTERAWKSAGVSPATATMIEGHGTSTRVGDLVEVQSLVELLGGYNLPAHSVALGSVKSNFGHLKGAAGAAGILKTVLAIKEKVLPPSVRCERPLPEINSAQSSLYVNTEMKPWDVPKGTPRRAGVSAFGFGGTNFHAVFEEYVPGMFNGGNGKAVAVTLPTEALKNESKTRVSVAESSTSPKAPLRGMAVLGAETAQAVAERLRTMQKAAAGGQVLPTAAPQPSELRAPERIAIDYGDASELASKAAIALKAFSVDQPGMWKALRAQGIFRGHGPALKVAFLYTGQGSQYVNMLRALRESEPIVAETFAEADRVMTPILGKPLSEFIFIDQSDAAVVEKAEDDLRQTAITQPAVLTVDMAMTRLLEAYGIKPDMAIGHSLGEYGALVASGALPFDEALEAVSARGKEMTRVSMQDNGKMAAVFAPLKEIERILKSVNGYAVIANVNSNAQAVIGGASQAIDRAVELFLQAGFNAVPLPVSHAFHTSIVAPASEPLREMLKRLHLEAPRIPVVANVNGEFYPTGSNVVPRMWEMLAQQIASPVQFVKGLETLYRAGARVFIEVGPKKALQGFADDVLGGDAEVLSLFTNHPKFTDVIAFNQALCGLYAAGLGQNGAVRPAEVTTMSVKSPKEEAVDSKVKDERRALRVPVVITGAALGLPGVEHIFDDDNVARILAGEQFIDVIPTRFRQAMLDKRVTRLVKSDNGGPSFESIDSISDVIKLAGRGHGFDLVKEFGVSADRVAAFDRDTQLAIAAGIDALRDAGIPLVMRYKSTTKGTQLPDRWGLADTLRDDTGVIFASAFPAYDSFAEQMAQYYKYQSRRDQLRTLEELLGRADAENGQSMISRELERRIADLKLSLEREPHGVNRRFLLRALSMAHSQFAEFIGARGPNTQINSACASTTQAISLAQDWIQAGRCRRVVVVSADDITTDNLLEWFGAAFLASGAAATDEAVEDAAIPFDRRRHGLIMGMGAAALVVESAEVAGQRGIRPICEVLSTVTANSAFHATRLSLDHISQMMENVVAEAEARYGIDRREMASRMMFVSHETYTPARGGSASAEIHALRKVFGDAADQIVIANTKGYTGHAMATGIEDVVAVKALETACVPPVPNFKEVDPELGELNLSKGGFYPIEYALRLGAGFGSQISMALFRWVKSADEARPNPNKLGYEYRIADQEVWADWISELAGAKAAALEVDRHMLRIRDERTALKLAAVAPAKSQVDASTPKLTELTVATSQRGPTVAAVQGAPEVRFSAIEAVSPGVAAGVEVKGRILQLVAEKTGYPVDMLALDLDLEADLGVDTVKQAEVFAAVREIYGIPRDPNLKLRDFPTLAHVIRFVEERRTDVAPKVTAPSVMGQDKRAEMPDVVPPPAVVKEREASGPPTAKATSGTIEVDAIKKRILALVVEKTGYPEDMLDLDLDLEADLGVDTVKQAEMFAAIREIYGIPRDPNLKLRDFPTLAHVIRFAQERTGVKQDVGPTAQAVVEQSPVPLAVSTVVAGPMPTQDSVAERVLELVVEKTGYPKEMLDLDLDLEADLGIDTVKQAELFASMRQIYSIERDPNLKLRDFPTLNHVIGFVYQKRPDLAPAKTVHELASQEPVSAKEVPPETVPETSVPTAAPVPSNNSGTSEMFEDHSVQDRVLELVVEKTGYPKEMLDLDLDLEADLGIDTVKQAELFASMRQIYGIERDPNLKLRDFPTLKHVIDFVYQRRPDLVHKGSKVENAGIFKEPEKVIEVTSAATPRIIGGFEAANRIPRRVPGPAIRPALNLCKKTGVTLDPGSRVLIMPDEAGVADALETALRKRGVSVLRLDLAADVEALARKWKEDGPLQGVYWLAGLDEHVAITEMQPSEWRKQIDTRLKLLYRCMRVLYASVAETEPFLVSATRLGGQHGYDDEGATRPLGGAVVGFTKAFKREQLNALVKAVDFAASETPENVADALINETLSDPGVVEVGYKAGLRWAVQLQEQAVSEVPGMKLNEETVFVVTGAAGSIVSAITADLAAASGGVFYLLDLVPKPDPSNKDLQRLTADRDALKRDIFACIQARGERATPALVEKELAALERSRAALDAIQAIEAAGGNAHYISLDLRDGNAVDGVIKEIRSEYGRVDVLVHAAGMERSHLLADKESGEFDLVFDVKADGFFNLLHAIGKMPLGATVVFSSIAGRFGNAGQTDYSAANDLLCKITSSMRRTHPATRAIAIDWTAWKNIGMASRGSIPKMMEVAGIDMLPPEGGIPIVRRELTASNFRGEVLIAEGLGILLNEWDPDGGLQAESMAKRIEELGPMVGKVQVPLNANVTVEIQLDPKEQPFLFHHQIEGTPVLPGVMGIETFAEAALSMMPGWRIASIENVDFTSPFKFYRSEPRTLKTVVKYSMSANDVIADCSLLGERSLATKPEPQITTHFTGRVRLTTKIPENKASSQPMVSAVEPIVEAKNIYKVFFHGPAYQVIARAWRDGDRMIGEFASALPANHFPETLATVLDPRLLELCLQTAGLWEITVEGRMGLPHHIDQVNLWRTPPSAGTKLFAIVTPNEKLGAFHAEVVDKEGNLYYEVCSYRTVTFMTDVDTSPLKWLQAVAA